MAHSNTPAERSRDGAGEQVTEEGTIVSSDLSQDGSGEAGPHHPGHRFLGTGIVILSICSLLWWETTRFPEVPAVLSQNVSAAFFPRVLLATAAILACLQVLRSWRLEPEKIKLPTSKTVASAVAIVLGVALLPTFGMLPVLFLMAIALPIILGERRWRPISIYALALPVVIWLVFTQLLQLRLPGGVLGF